MATPKITPRIYTGIGIDFETGGLDCCRCACTEIALQAVRFDTWEIFDRYSKYIYPYDRQQAGATKRKILRTKYEMAAPGQLMDYEEVALNYSGIKMDDLYKNGVNLDEVAGKVISFATDATLSKGAQFKPILIGQNIPFDIGFLQQLMAYTGRLSDFEKVFAGKKDFYGNFQPHYIDTITLARMAFAGDESVTSYKLEIIAEKLQIELNDAHNADADTTAAIEVARKFANRMQSGNVHGDGGHKTVKSREHFKI